MKCPVEVDIALLPQLFFKSMTSNLVAWVISAQPHPKDHGWLIWTIATGGT